VTTPFSTRIAAAVCAGLCLLFAVISVGVASSKSATYDEPLHVATGWLNLQRGDFRLSPDVPPLWEYWIALPLPRDALNFDATPANAGLDHRAIAAMYQTARTSGAPADGVRWVNESRWMSLPLAVALATLVAIAAARLAGPVAAVAATFAFVFDPNWLGHGPLAKNDVAFAFVFLAAAYAIWRVGVRINIRTVLAVLLLPAICLGTKLSGLIVLPLAAFCLLIRAISAAPWPTRFASRSLQTPLARLAFALVLIAASAIVTYAGLWAQYRFRFDAGPDGLQLDFPAMVRDLRDAEVRSQFHVDQPTPQQLAAWQPTISTQAVIWLENHRLVPQACAAGFIFTQTSAHERNAYLMGDVYPGASLFYFPLAWLFKEPLALLAATILACFSIRGRRAEWPAATMSIFAGVYLFMAITGDVNIGLRHVFPVLPFIAVAIGAAAARAWPHKLGRMTVVILAAALAAETLAAYPDFLAFFNIASGGERGGLVLLGDSNLDWGQDLPLLAQWQNEHPNVPLYLDYFGTCDPRAYGIRYLNVPGGYEYGPPPTTNGPGVAAISATKLQRLFVADPAVDFATPFERRKPIAVLGGTIYLFDYPPR
jgi:hypothetical protein